MKRGRAVKAFFLGLTVLLAGPAAAGETTWYVIVTDSGTQIGHASEDIVETAQGREITESQEVDVGEQVGPSTQLIGRVGAPSHVETRTLFKEDAAGRTLSISASTAIGRDWSHTEARIDGSEVEISRETPVEKRSSKLTLPQGVRFDAGDGLLKGWDPKTAPKLEFDNFNIDAMAVDRMTIEAVSGPDAQGRIRALRKRYDGAQLLAASRIVVDRGGRIVETAQPLFDATILVKLSDRDSALKAHPIYRVLPSVMRKSPFLISTTAKNGHIRYRFSFREGIVFALPETGEQRVHAEPGFATVDICADCGPGMASDKRALEDALKPTVWLQSDHPRLKALVAEIAKLDVSDARKMELLIGKAKPYLGTIDFTGHYSALETLSRRAGDCTEASVLLAALGRAAGIPTRVVNGLVYSRESYHGVSNVFMPHSWTLAFVDGKWKSFDLALDTFDSTHIAITVGDGDERSLLAASQLAGLLKWENMAEVRPAPSP